MAIQFPAYNGAGTQAYPGFSNLGLFSGFQASPVVGGLNNFAGVSAPQIALAQMLQVATVLMGMLTGLMAGQFHGQPDSGVCAPTTGTGGTSGSGGPAKVGPSPASHSRGGRHSGSTSGSPVDGGQIWQGAQGKGHHFKAGMAIDTDGTGSSHGDRWHQNQTSMQLANGRSLNADSTPYIVLPPQLAKQLGAKPGDLALVRYKGKVSPAIFGDVGPRNKLGEGSTRLAKNLGINSNPNTGGIDGGVEYQIFPGSGRGIRWSDENTTTEALWQRIRSMKLG